MVNVSYQSYERSKSKLEESFTNRKETIQEINYLLFLYEYELHIKINV